VDGLDVPARARWPLAEPMTPGEKSGTKTLSTAH
jgi:hypothetical protein